tara:strand:- start:4878 stop:5924 length:1047 start_codon:yes stop_codon:yes gene_type:complete
MKQHEREYFVARIRSGIYKIKLGELDLKIVPLTLEQELDVQQCYVATYRQAEKDGFLTHEDLLESMKERGLWSEEDEERIKGLEKDIDRLKVELFQNKNKEDLVERIRTYLKAGKEQLDQQLSKKMANYDKSCEGIAQVKKVEKIMELSCVYADSGEPYDFKDVDVTHIVRLFGLQVLSESSAREIARTEPWHSTWVLKDSNTFEFFNYKGRQLTTDQKNVIVWSRMYDSVHESMDCPSEDVIQDDDMLDGWFILQKKKRDQEKVQAEIEQSTSNPKIASSDEIFVMAHSQKDADRINKSNNINAQQIKRKRAAVLERQGEAKDLDFQDQQLRLRAQSNEMYKGKFRR